MLSDNTQVTPRPRPPAKARRLPSLQFPKIPPPPYAPSLDMVLDAAVSAPTQLVGAALDGVHLPLPAPDIEEWMNEKSREELSGLLLKADELIKSRESELSLTSALCKSLYHDNVSLKNKHETLLARLPATRSSSPAIASPAISPPSAALSPAYEGSSLPLSPSYTDAPLPPGARTRHTRRISVTPADLMRLADQNSELLEKLERLETESQQADQAGKRKLRKLEKEIQGLREELERTQAKEAELEEQARQALDLSKGEAQRRREEREERLKALKEKSASGSDDASDEVRDFAPASELAALQKSNILKTSPPVISRTISSPSTLNISTKPVLPISHAEEGVPPSYFARNRFLSQSGAEYAITSQLLLKIRELEETNAQIKEEQRMTEERLRAAQWDVEGIRRMYDCLSDGAEVELEVVHEDEPDSAAPSPSKANRVPSGGTIKFSSLRRSIHQDLSRLHEPDEPDGFASGITNEMQSTSRSAIVPSRRVASHKTRKSVVGLFDPEPAFPDASPSCPPSLSTATPFRLLPSAFEFGDADISMWSTAATDGLPASPARTITSPLLTPAEGPALARTLRSELGSECGDAWGARAPNHHLRTTSLCDLASPDLSREASASPPAPVFVFPPLDDSADFAPSTSTRRTDESWDAGADEDAGPSTPPRRPGLLLNVEPPTPTPERLERPASLRARRLSQTMRSRTHRWVEGRFGRSPEPELEMRSRRRRDGAQAGGSSLSGAGPGGIMGETLHEVVRQVSRESSRGSAPASASETIGAEPDGRKEGEAGRSVELHHTARAETSAVVDPMGARKEGFVGFMLEVWLWLQFAVVILVFLYAMAKRGPKSVLAEAEQRRAGRNARH
ncbi:hypothetical protein AcW1_004390 [Taiwanofungus camphoratus]|nr:hypothetical protein AcW1_004390 [Antrodia cinnamomea]